MRRTGSFALVLVFTIGLVACSGSKGGKATPTSTPRAATAVTAATAVPAQPIPTVEGVATVTASGLQITDTIVGTGAEAKLGDTVTVQYTGYLDDGTVFDGPAIHGGPAQFQLAVGSLIPGWIEGVPGVKVGGKRRLIIPPALAYGASGSGPVPPNSRLTFDIELVSIP